MLDHTVLNCTIPTNKDLMLLTSHSVFCKCYNEIKLLTNHDFIEHDIGLVFALKLTKF
jgi:hypothetical protein